ncbi:MAG: alpha/beta hydrolase [Roseobacter sp.]
MNLDDAYANAAYIKDAASYPPRWTQTADGFRQRLADRAELGISYGESDRQAFDFFHADGAAKGTVVFVHGGYWLRFDRSYWSHFAHGALSLGWNVAMPSYDLCPTVSIAQITNQIASAVHAIARKATGPVTLTGHSAGGHLVARMLDPGVLPAEVLARISRVAPISPVADLRPLLHTSMNADFKLDMAGAVAESPVLQPAPDIAVSVWVGADERPVFLEQAKALSVAWDVAQVIVPGRHHFDVIDALQDGRSDLIRFLTLQ